MLCRYVAPEYAMTGHLLVKSDVYSYGVVLLELLSGRKPVDMTQPPGSENLVTWARPLLTSQEGLQQLVDPSMPAGYDFEKLAKAAAIASMCVHVEASHRPFMGEVVQALKLIHSGSGGAGDETRSGSFGRGGGATEEPSPWGGDGSRSTWNDDVPTTPAFLRERDYSSAPAGANETSPRPRSASSAVLDKIESLAMYDWSGPLRAKGSLSFYRLRGSMSEHGRPSDDGSVEGYWL
jgi:serine/threonine protein kinase